MHPSSKTEDFIDTLTHELIHQIFFQNWFDPSYKKYRKLEAYIERKYGPESQNTKIHIILHSMLAQVYLNLHREDRLNADIAKCKEWKDYRRAWSIASKEGYQNIVERLQS